MANIKIGPTTLAYHNANRYYDIFSKKRLLEKEKHVENVIALSKKIASFLNYDVDMTLLEICAEHHDDGCVDQYELIGNFWDNQILPNALGIFRLRKFMEQQKDVKNDLSLSILHDVILHHGRIHLTDLSDESKPYVEIVSLTDDLENAYSFVSRIIKEVKTDTKGYIKENPKADQKEVSKFVWEHFEDGEKFDEETFCSTYAEYVLFAATLATNCIKQYGEIAKIIFSQPRYGYSSIIEGYRDVFSNTLTPSMATQAIVVIESMIA